MRVNRALLLRGEPAGVPIQAIEVHGTPLLDQHARRLAVDLDLGRRVGNFPRLTGVTGD